MARVAAGAFGFLIFSHFGGPSLQTKPAAILSIGLFDGLPKSPLDKLLCNFAKMIFAASSLDHSLRDIVGYIA